LTEAEDILSSLASEQHAFLREGDSLPDPFFHLGRVALLRGRGDLSAAYLHRALGNHPGDPIILSQLACQTGDPSFAEKVFRYFDDIDASFFLGRSCLAAGQAELALQHFDRLASFLPDNPRVSVYRAAALSASGRYAEAVALYLDVAGERPPMVMLEDRVLAAFEQAARNGAAEPTYQYGTVLRQYGHFTESLRMLQKAARSGYSPAAAASRELQSMIDRASGQ
jgi:tetratricopeptide (TPR) repeat protein